METKRHYALSLVVEGRLIIGEESGRQRIFEANQLFESAPGYRCWTRIDPDLEYRDLLVHCDPATFEIMRTLDVLPMGELISGQRVGAGARLAFEALGEWLEHRQSCVWSLAVVRLIEFFDAIKRDVDHENVQVERRLILEAARRLESRLEEQLSIEELWEGLPEDYSRLRRSFKRVVGIAPGQYRARWRMSQARRLLISGQSVAEVGQILGYSDAFAFSKQFKRVVGMSPSEARSEALSH